MCTNKMSNIGMRNGKEEGKEREERQRRQEKGRGGRGEAEKRQGEGGEPEEREREGREFHSTIPSNRHSNQLTELAKNFFKN